MRLNDPVSRRRVIGLTALIDVVFLLLVFFMLASTFLKFGTVGIETAGGGGSKVDPEKIVLVHVAPEGAFLVNGAPTGKAELVGAINALVDKGRSTAVLVMKPDAKVEDLVSGLTTVRQSRAGNVRIVD